MALVDDVTAALVSNPLALNVSLPGARHREVVGLSRGHNTLWPHDQLRKMYRMAEGKMADLRLL